MDGLTEGRMVHYVMPNGYHRPAIVVNVLSKELGYVTLVVFVDTQVDNYPDGANTVNVTAPYSEEPKVDTWHWIEKA